MADRCGTSSHCAKVQFQPTVPSTHLKAIAFSDLWVLGSSYAVAGWVLEEDIDSLMCKLSYKMELVSQPRPLQDLAISILKRQAQQNHIARLCSIRPPVLSSRSKYGDSTAGQSCYYYRRIQRYRQSHVTSSRGCWGFSRHQLRLGCKERC